MPYPTPPAPRLAYDKDGTAVFISRYDGTLAVLDLAPAAKAALNSERVSGLVTLPYDTYVPAGGNSVFQGQYHAWYGANVQQAFVAFIFPVPTRLHGVFPALVYDPSGAGNQYQGCADVYGSADTTNGLDGTWTLIASRVRSFKGSPYGVTVDRSPGTTDWTRIDGSTGTKLYLMPPNNDAYRRLMATSGVGITGVSGSATRNLRGVRFNFYSSDNPSGDQNEVVWPSGSDNIATVAIHLYGVPDTGAAGENRIGMWLPDLDLEAPAGTFDWGDTPLGSTADKSFRIKNLSSAKTATSVVVATSASMTDGPTGSKASQQFLYSMDNKVSWSNSITVAALSPGATSGLLWVRRTTPITAALSNWSPRVLAEVGAWT